MAMLMAASLLSSASLGGLLFAASTGADAVEAGAGQGNGGLTVDVGGLNCALLPGATSYKQHNAPTDIMGLFSAIYDRVNEDLEDVVQVEINYVGDVIHRLVGTHDVQATVTRVQELEDGEQTTQQECLVVPVVIEDTDECTLPEHDPMHHECHPSTVCVNTIGSYACTCTGGEPCVPKSGNGFCSSVTSSAECCAVDEHQREGGCRDNNCASECRRDFRCYTDQCGGKCVYPETCSSRRGLVSCKCKEELGEVGNGKICPGLTPTLYADAEGKIISTDVDPSSVCGCQVPTRDPCYGVTCGQHSFCKEENGKATCKCKSGFRDVPGHGCMDDSAPALKLKGPAELTMKQCEKYVERGVEVMDSNSENDDRKVGVTYSQPPGKCTPEMGSFTVNYTLNTGWTHPAVQYIVRHVTVTDVDECSLDPDSPEAQCPGCRAQCHRHAKCENRVGTYTCKCPACMEGDGFEPFIPRKSMRIPPGFEGGSGCADNCPPVITLKGDNPMVITTAVTVNLQGDIIRGRNYTAELEHLIASTQGSGLCEDGDHSRCAKVVDNNGTHTSVDITDRLNILKPVQTSTNPPRWTVTYQATDEAGNYAEPVNRIIEIQELTVDEYAEMKCAEALAKKGKCPECVRECPVPSATSTKATTRCPPCEKAGAPDCSKCSCKSRPDCLSTAECTERQGEVAATAARTSNEGGLDPWQMMCMLLGIVWFIVVFGITCWRQVYDPTIVAPAAATPATPMQNGSRSGYAASPTPNVSSNGGASGRASQRRVGRAASNGRFDGDVRPITPNSAGGR